MNGKTCRVGILTLGCKVNQYESEAVAEEARRRGFDVFDAGESPDCSLSADAYIVNTCTVTAEADRKSRQMIRRLHARNPSSPIIVTGCTAETSSAAVAAIEGVSAVCGNGSKLAVVDMLEKLTSYGLPAEPVISLPPLNLSTFEPMKLASFPRTRMYIKIEDGCENRCAYCAIPGARGPVRSKAPADVISEIRGFIEAGCREVVLIGIETASYGRDLDGVTLGNLLVDVDKICRTGGDCRVRLGSLDPSLFKPDFVNIIKGLPSLAPHFHISLQSGCSRTLARMRRKYTAEGASDALCRLRQAIPGVMFTTDVITGFPGETDEDFTETLGFIRRERFLMAHVFPFSPRRGTPAASMPEQVPPEIRRQRAAILSEVESKVRCDILTQALCGLPERDVLFESYDNGYAQGHTADFLSVRAPSPVSLHGITRNVRLISHDGLTVTGEISG